MLQHILHRSIKRLEEVEHLLGLLVEEGLVDLGKITSLERIERWG